MQKGRNRGDQGQSQATRLDPIALTIAVWLGLVVSAAAIERLSADAMTQANMAELRGAAPAKMVRPMTTVFAPYGT